MQQLRRLKDEDYPQIIQVVDDWWGGRQMADMLPRLFFQHFSDTSFIVEEDGRPAAFLVGFLSQSRPGEAYIHFVGVDPTRRQEGLGRQLYERFFETVAGRGATTVHCVTSPINQRSVAFHRAMGFRIEAGSGTADGVPVHANYDGRGHDRVVFTLDL